MSRTRGRPICSSPTCEHAICKARRAFAEREWLAAALLTIGRHLYVGELRAVERRLHELDGVLVGFPRKALRRGPYYPPPGVARRA